ncbi:uncharacterized protein LOC120614244 isoform X13 [Pteropus medius]|uniref:uncharacterized protein LOC120614244 isoform X13 n=1 Tax=Pteropus vampyrus TaxID=132908 RepID=UPI00196B4021|nr:uncharacterized protein LOC120614244 isoform X13 [Pteropus giganteus]
MSFRQVKHELTSVDVRSIFLDLRSPGSAGARGRRMLLEHAGWQNRVIQGTGAGWLCEQSNPFSKAVKFTKTAARDLSQACYHTSSLSPSSVPLAVSGGSKMEVSLVLRNASVTRGELVGHSPCWRHRGKEGGAGAEVRASLPVAALTPWETPLRHWAGTSQASRSSLLYLGPWQRASPFRSFQGSVCVILTVAPQTQRRFCLLQTP